VGADFIVVSIFVNPTQFAPGEDSERYPRDEARDQRLLEEHRADLIFMPPVEAMYPPGATTTVSVGAVASPLEGDRRPGHFEGVATIVAKLFHIVDPDVAIFGEKDFQQLTVIRRMVADLCLRVEIVGAPTVRESDGLAMSSRNQYLSAQERQLAPAIYRQLNQAIAALKAGERDYARIEAAGRAALDGLGFRTDYFAVRDARSLAPATPDTRNFVVLVASRLGKARLIDNVQFTAD
jgi:pantoate--beta-alanine ligase